MKTRPMLTLEDCRKITAWRRAEARKNSWNVCIAILDDGGHLLHLARMDGASPANAHRDRGRLPRGDAALDHGLAGAHRQGPSSSKMPQVTPVQGGLPIMADGVCVGAVGISGVQSHEDEQIAAAGIKALG